MLVHAAARHLQASDRTWRQACVCWPTLVSFPLSHLGIRANIWWLAHRTPHGSRKMELTWDADAILAQNIMFPDGFLGIGVNQRSHKFVVSLVGVFLQGNLLIAIHQTAAKTWGIRRPLYLGQSYRENGFRIGHLDPGRLCSRQERPQCHIRWNSWPPQWRSAQLGVCRTEWDQSSEEDRSIALFADWVGNESGVAHLGFDQWLLRIAEKVHQGIDAILLVVANCSCYVMCRL